MGQKPLGLPCGSQPASCAPTRTALPRESSRSILGGNRPTGSRKLGTTTLFPGFCLLQLEVLLHPDKGVSVAYQGQLVSELRFPLLLVFELRFPLLLGGPAVHFPEIFENDQHVCHPDNRRASDLECLDPVCLQEKFSDTAHWKRLIVNKEHVHREPGLYFHSPVVSSKQRRYLLQFSG